MGHPKKTKKMTPINPTSIVNPRHRTTNTNFCRDPLCFFCIMEEAETLRSQKIATFFEEMPRKNDNNVVIIVSWIWNLAMSNPDNPEFPSLGVFECMGKLIQKGVNDTEWLHRDENIHIPYYAAHIIGSYTMNNPCFAEQAVESGVIPPLMELFRGKMSWVEQRVATRALGHLASYEVTFVALAEYEEEVVRLSMNVSSTCINVVYEMFVSFQEREKRLKYHCDLLTRGVGGMDIENRKAEEWASQLQCWSLYLLNCFAYKKMSLSLICKPVFLRNLCKMWGGLMNDSSPAGFGLIRILCYTKYGRKCIAEMKEVVVSLGNLARSSDDWQYVGIDCLLLLLQDTNTRLKVIDIAIEFLVDLVELKQLGEKSNIGQAIMSTLMQDDAHLGNKVRARLEELRAMMEKGRMEKMMSEEKVMEMKGKVSLMKQQGNELFWVGKVEEAIQKYTQGLKLCPLKLKRQRIVLFSNRAQCHLLVKDIDGVIRDTTRALCLTTPPNSHHPSLWRRSQAYDMKGLGKESLMDCIMFLTCCNNIQKSTNYVKIPRHAALMISKQMEAMSLFKSLRSKVCDSDGGVSSNGNYTQDDEVRLGT